MLTKYIFRHLFLNHCKLIRGDIHSSFMRITFRRICSLTLLKFKHDLSLAQPNYFPRILQITVNNQMLNLIDTKKLHCDYKTLVYMYFYLGCLFDAWLYWSNTNEWLFLNLYYDEWEFASLMLWLGDNCQNRLYYFNPFSTKCSTSIPPKNIRKPDVFWCFQGL